MDNWHVCLSGGDIKAEMNFCKLLCYEPVKSRGLGELRGRVFDSRYRDTAELIAIHCENENWALDTWQMNDNRNCEVNKLQSLTHNGAPSVGPCERL